MKNLRQSRGRCGEVAAQNFLEEAGYTLIDVNVRLQGSEMPRGELDIVAWEGGTLCFIEVKTRYGSRFATPAEAVTLAKQQQIHRLALAYVTQAGLLSPDTEDIPFRFDVVAVYLTGSETNPEGSNTERVRHVELIRGAFLAPEE